MKFVTVVLFCAAALSLCSGEDAKLKCKPRPGCSFAGCIPTEYSEEYHIECQPIGGFSSTEAMEKRVNATLHQLQKSNKRRFKGFKEQFAEISQMIKIKDGGEDTEDYSGMIEQFTESFSAKFKEMREEFEELEEEIEQQIEVEVEERLSELRKQLDAKYQRQINVLDSKMEKLQALVEAGGGGTEPKITDRSYSSEVKFCKLTKEAQCAVKCNGFCFWAIPADGGAMVFSESEKRCKRAGGTPANVYNKQQYETVLEYLATFPLTSIEKFFKVTQAWLGMKYDPQKKTAKNYDGSPATFFAPKQSGMQKPDLYVHLILEVSVVKSNPLQLNKAKTSMYNHIPWSSFPRILCETKPDG